MEVIRHKVRSTSKAMAIGVGNCGGNVVNYLFASGESNISYLLFNTDRQALRNSRLPDNNKILLGTEGLGARNIVQDGRQMALDSETLIRDAIQHSGAQMVFVIAGMGGGTGSGAAPVIAEIAKSAGFLTIGVITIPFESELHSKREQAASGVREMINAVDSLIVVDNSQITRQYGSIPLSSAYLKSNELVSTAVRGLSDLISERFIVHAGFAQVRQLMINSEVTLMGVGISSGPDRVLDAVDMAFTSPFLNIGGIDKAENILVRIATSSDCSFELRIRDFKNIRDHVLSKVKIYDNSEMIFGVGIDDSLGDKIQITLFAVGFKPNDISCLSSLLGIESPVSKPVTMAESPVKTSQPAKPAPIAESTVKTSQPARHGVLKPVPIVASPVKPSQSTKPVTIAESPVKLSQPARHGVLKPVPIVASPVRKEPLQSAVSSVATEVGAVSGNTDQKKAGGIPNTIFHDFTDTMPAYQRRKIRLGCSASAETSETMQKQSRRRKFVLELDEPEHEVRTPSLFDDF